MEKCLVTGGTGHIGNVLIRELSEKGFDVTALVRSEKRAEALKGLKIKLEEGDIRDKEKLRKLIDEDTIVFHLAGIINIASIDPDTVYDTNVKGTENIVDVCVEKRAKRFIYTSSVHVIEPVSGKVLTEPNEFDETKIKGTYAKSKTIAVKYVFDACKNRGLNGVVLYPSGVIGPGDYKVSELGQVMLDFVNGKLLARIKGGYDFVDVRDVASGIIAAFRKGRIGEGYILSGRYVSLKELFEKINEKTGRKGMPPLLAAGFVKAFAGICERYYRKRGKKPVFTKYSIETLQGNADFSHEKAQKELGYETRPLSETIGDAIDWFIAEKPEKIDLGRFKRKRKK